MGSEGCAPLFHARAWVSGNGLSPAVPSGRSPEPPAAPPNHTAVLPAQAGAAPCRSECIICVSLPCPMVAPLTVPRESPAAAQGGTLNRGELWRVQEDELGGLSCHRGDV